MFTSIRLPPTGKLKKGIEQAPGPNKPVVAHKPDPMCIESKQVGFIFSAMSLEFSSKEFAWEIEGLVRANQLKALAESENIEKTMSNTKNTLLENISLEFKALTNIAIAIKPIPR